MDGIMTVQDQLRLIPQRIAERVSAKKIYLFGSRAYGCPDEESDIDLCVVADLHGKQKIEVMREVRKAIASFVTYPVDIIVYGEQEFRARAAFEHTMEHKIVEKGVLLYG